MEVTIKEIAQIVNGTVEGDGNITINAPGKIEDSGPGQITFLSNPKYENYLYTTQASAVLISNDFVLKQPVKTTLIRVKDVQQALITLMNKFNTSISDSIEVSSETSVSEELANRQDLTIGAFTVIHPTAQIGKNVVIGSQVFIGKGVIIGDDVEIHPGVKIYHDCIIGNSTIIQSNSVIGSDGFGFVPDENNIYKKVPQLGIVRIGNHVDIGANVVVDRATMGETYVGDGVKLDNLIQIAHNVKVGENTVMAAQSGIAGSSVVGKNNVIGGQVGIIGHLKVGDNNKIQGQSGVTSNIGDDTALYGTPAIDYKNYVRSYVHFKNISEMEKRIKELEKRLNSESTGR